MVWCGSRSRLTHTWRLAESLAGGRVEPATGTRSPRGDLGKGNMTVKYVVIGPNLSQAGAELATHHVHAEGCRDLRNYGPGGKYGGDAHDVDFSYELLDRSDLNSFLYGDFAGDEGVSADEYVDTWGTDHHVFPCAAALK